MKKQLSEIGKPVVNTPFKMERGVKYRDAAKTSIIPVKLIDPEQELLKKPDWMKIKLPANSAKIQSIKNDMRRHGLHSVCEEASCPNLHECFNHGTATFMIMGAICTRRCHGARQAVLPDVVIVFDE